MPRLRSRCAALALVLALSLSLSPLASAAPMGPVADDTWWSALAGLFDFFELLGRDGIKTVRAPTGPHLEPDGVMFTGDPDGSDDFTLTDGTEPGDGDGTIAPIAPID